MTSRPLLHTRFLRPAVAAVLVSSAVTALTTAARAAGPAAVPAAVPAERAELGERLLQVAQRLINGPYTRDVAAALTDIATPMAEGEPRLLRAAIDLRLSLGDRDQAIELLTAYRRLDPADQLAQVQSIDLHQSKLESVSEKADYLARVAGSEKVSAEVRAHAATLLAAIELERGRDDASAAAVAQALALNPTNAKALRFRADAAGRSADGAERVTALVNLLKADPLQFATASRVAEELLRAGVTDAAAETYRELLDAVDAAGYGPGADDSINAASALQIAGRPRDAAAIASDAMKDDPGDLRLHAMRLLLTRAQNDDAGYASALGDARTQAVRNLMGLHTQVDPAAPKPDGTTAVALPDVNADAAALKARPDARRLAMAYAEALGDLAWLDAFYGNRAPDAAVAEAIQTLIGPDGLLTHRTAGFAALAAGKFDEADVAFSPVADRDPLSRLGLLVLRIKKGQDKTAIIADAGKLLATLPTDVWPLTIRQAVKDAGAPSFRSPDADKVAAAAAALPADVLAFAKEPRGAYLLDLSPVTGSVEIGQPILVRVTLQNTLNRPLAIGPGGAVGQGVVLDATVRGITAQEFPATAIAKLTQRLVVPPRQTTTTVVRLDGPDLGAFLAALPQAGASVFVSGVSNPVVRQNGVSTGPGGFRTQARDVIDRPQVALNRPDVRDALAKKLASPDAVQRLRGVLAVGACTRFFASQAAANADVAGLVEQGKSMLTAAADHDASPTVRAMARQELAGLGTDAAAAAAGLKSLTTSPDAEARVLGALSTLRLNRADRQAVLAPLLADADAGVKKLAVALAALPETPAATTQETPAK